jgi:hypothetical protein
MCGNCALEAINRLIIWLSTSKYPRERERTRVCTYDNFAIQNVYSNNKLYQHQQLGRSTVHFVTITITVLLWIV